MDAMEEKVNCQMLRLQQHNDKLRESALSRVDSKMIAFEAWQPKLDRRLAELSGQVRGLSEEMQSQIRRLDSIDSRFVQVRPQVDELLQAKFGDFSAELEKLASTVRVQSQAAADDLRQFKKRVGSLQSALDDRCMHDDRVLAELDGLQGRIAELEETGGTPHMVSCTNVDASPAEAFDIKSAHVEHSTSLAELQSRLTGMLQKVETLQASTDEAHSRLEAQEERLKNLRTSHDKKHEQVQSLMDSVKRSDWDGKLKALERKVADHDTHRIDHDAKSDSLHRRLSEHESIHQQVRQEVKRINEHIATNSSAQDSLEATNSNGCIVPHADSLAAYREVDLLKLSGRVVELESQVAALQHHGSRRDLENRMEAVLVHVREVSSLAPKVLRSEDQLCSLADKVSQLELAIESASAHSPEGDGSSRRRGDALHFATTRSPGDFSARSDLSASGA